jgi:hypothetical protein
MVDVHGRARRAGGKSAGSLGDAARERVILRR